MGLLARVIIVVVSGLSNLALIYFFPSCVLAEGRVQVVIGASSSASWPLCVLSLLLWSLALSVGIMSLRDSNRNR